MSKIIVPATITLTCVTASNLVNTNGRYDPMSTVKPIGATLIAFGVLSAASGQAPKLTNLFAWTITGTAVVTLGMPIIAKYFPTKG